MKTSWRGTLTVDRDMKRNKSPFVLHLILNTQILIHTWRSFRLLRHEPFLPTEPSILKMGYNKEDDEEVNIYYFKPHSPCRFLSRLFPSGLLQQEAEKYAGFIHSIDFALEQRQTERDGGREQGERE